MSLDSTVLIYLLIGLGVAVAVYVSDRDGTLVRRWFAVGTAIPFWPIYVTILLSRQEVGQPERPSVSPPPPTDEMAAAIHQVDTELEAALTSLDGWAEGVLAREKDRIHELRTAWTAQSERIREMDRLLALPEYAEEPGNGSAFGPAVLSTPLSPTANDRLRHSQQVRRQNIERLRQVRRRAYEDLMGTLAWVRELVSMIHLAKFTGAPASRAEELVAQIAAAVEGLSELTWQDESIVAAGDSISARG
jgi:hypothetical protein